MTREKRVVKEKPIIPVLWLPKSYNIPPSILTHKGIQKMAQKKGFKVQLYEDAQSWINENKEEPLIVIGEESSRMPLALRQLHDAGRRVVVTGVDTDHIDADYSCSTFSRRLATEQMMDYLRGKGCSRTAFIGVARLSANDQVHIAALLRYVEQHPGADARCFYYETRVEESFEAFSAEHAFFDSVLCPNVFVAVAFLHFCEQAGYRVPRDFLVVSVKDGLINTCCKPSLTALSVDFHVIGEQAVLVWKYLKDNPTERVRMRIAVQGEIVPRESTGIELSRSREDRLQHPLGQRYEGGPFASEPTLQSLMRVERCLQCCDPLDLRIIGLIIEEQHNYETVAEKLFLSESSLQYRLRKIFHAAQTESRREFVKLFEGCFTKQNHFDESP